MSIFTSQFYINSPSFMQDSIVSLRGLGFKLLREGKTFRDMLSKLEESQYYSAEELKEVQREKLRLMIRHCHDNVPYYRKLFRRLNLRPDDFKEISDLNKLPILTKQEVKADPEEFRAKNIDRRFIRKVFTSGTTGSPLGLYRDLHSINFENAIVRRQYNWAGVKSSARKMVLRSSPIVPSSVKRPPFWRHDCFQRAMLLSAYHLSEENIASYFEKILKFKPVALETVPSAVYLLAKLMHLKDMKMDLEYIFTSSEVLMPHQKTFIRQQFNCKVFDHYGTAERAAAIGMCEKGTYHIYPEYAITELLPIRENDGYFEIMGTGLNNFAMPLLRYKTGDVVMPSSKKCTCGRNFQRIELIQGRMTDEFFMTKDGRFVSLLSGMLSADLKGIIETQFVQEEFDRIRVNIVTSKGYTGLEESKLRKSVKNFLGDDIQVDIKRVSSIPRTEGGKFKQFISKIKQDSNEKVRF